MVSPTGWTDETLSSDEKGHNQPNIDIYTRIFRPLSLYLVVHGKNRHAVNARAERKQ